MKALLCRSVKHVYTSKPTYNGYVEIMACDVD